MTMTMTPDEQAALFHCLGSPLRLRLFGLLIQERGTLSVLDLTARLRQEGYPSQDSNVSMQLQQMQRAGLVMAHRDGRYSYYNASPVGVARLLALVQGWHESLGL